MTTKETLEIIEQEIKNLFQKLEAQIEITSTAEEDGSVSVNVTMAEPQIFIGENGQTLLEIQHIVRSMLRKILKEPLWILLDINGYRKSKEIYVKELANSTADEVALLKKEKELPPMSSAERRIVHVVISTRADVVSESIGEEPERRIVIRPASPAGGPKA